MENRPPKSHMPAKLADTYTECNEGVGVDLLVLPDADEQVFEFLNIVDFVTRFTICFPVPSERPDDVLSVLEMVWMNWAGPMNHLISDVGSELGELDSIIRHPKLRSQTDLSIAISVSGAWSRPMENAHDPRNHPRRASGTRYRNRTGKGNPCREEMKILSKTYREREWRGSQAMWTRTRRI